jgi:hypothetical protein
MSHPSGPYSKGEVASLSKKQQAQLLKEARRYLCTDEALNKLIRHVPKIRRELRKRLRPMYRNLKSKR